MLYSIIDTRKGEGVGFRAFAHQTFANGDKMIVNENELRTLGEDIEAEAARLGGKLLSFGEILNEQKKDKQ